MAVEPKDATALEEAIYITNVANAVMVARKYDPAQCSRGLAVIATVVAGDDPTARTALAKTMLELAHELDPALVCATWQ